MPARFGAASLSSTTAGSLITTLSSRSKRSAVGLLDQEARLHAAHLHAHHLADLHAGEADAHVVGRELLDDEHVLERRLELARVDLGPVGGDASGAQPVPVRLQRGKHEIVHSKLDRARPACLPRPGAAAGLRVNDFFTRYTTPARKVARFAPIILICSKFGETSRQEIAYSASRAAMALTSMTGFADLRRGTPAASPGPGRRAASTAAGSTCACACPKASRRWTPPLRAAAAEGARAAAR